MNRGYNDYQNAMRDITISIEKDDKSYVAFVTRGELEERLKDQRITLIAELYEDLLKSILGNSINSPMIRNNQKNDNIVNDTGDVSEKLNNCSDVLNSVMNWSED